jgi:ankyrin repeat protein
MQLQVSDDTVFSLVFSTTQFFDYFSDDNLPGEPLGSGTHVVLERVVIGNQDATTKITRLAFVQFILDILALLQDMVPLNRGNFQPNVLLVRLDSSNPDESPWTVEANTYSEGLDIQSIRNAIAHLPLPQGWVGLPVNFIVLYGIWGGGVFRHQGADLESKYSSSRALLSWAVESGHEAVVKPLLENGAGLHSKDKYIRTPSLAIWSGREAVVKLLFDKGAELDSKDKYSRLLSLAIENGHVAVVKLLFDKGAELGSKDKYSRLLSLAIENGHVAVVELLLEKGAELESKDEEYGRAPLSLATASGHKGVVQLLLEKGARLESKDISGWTPLMWAVNGSHETVVQLLLEKGAELESKDGEYAQTPLSLAAMSGHETVVQQLLEKGARLESKDRRRWTPLLWAAERGNTAVVKLLLEKGSESESKDNLERTPLTWAALRGYETVVQLLLAKDNVDPNPRDRFGLTPLLLAAKNGYHGIVKLLLEKCREDDIVIRDEEINISMPPAAQYPSRVCCNICVSSIPNGDVHYHCGICDSGDFDICRECIASEYLCLDHSHKLVKRIFKCGTLVEVPDKTPHTARILFCS